MVNPGVLVRGARNPLHYTLGARLKKARRTAGVQPTLFCKSLGLSHDTIGRIERGGVPGVDVVEKLARGLTMSPCLLAFGVGAGVALAADGPLGYLQIGERLREAREGAGLSLRALGRAADLTPTAISNIESAKVLPGVDVAESLAGALKISPCWLAFGEGEPTGPRFPQPIRRKRTMAPRRARQRQ